MARTREMSGRMRLWVADSVSMMRISLRKGFNAGDGMYRSRFIPAKLRFPFSQLLEEGAHVFWHFGFEGMEGGGSVGDAEGLGVEAEAGEDGAFLFFGAGQLEVPFDGGQEYGAAVTVEV